MILLLKGSVEKKKTECGRRSWEWGKAQSGQTKFTASSRSRRVFTSTKNSTTSKVFSKDSRRRDLELVHPIQTTSQSSNEEECTSWVKAAEGDKAGTKRATKPVKTPWDLLTHHVHMIYPSEGVIGYNFKEFDVLNTLNGSIINLQCWVAIHNRSAGMNQHWLCLCSIYLQNIHFEPELCKAQTEL